MLKLQPLLHLILIKHFHSSSPRRHPGAAPSVRSGDGAEDEHPGQQQGQHAQGGPAHEPTITPEHTQVAEMLV